MAAGMNATKRFFIRLSLVTGSTLATIIGAQSLASLEALPTSEAPPPPADTTASNAPVQAWTPTPGEPSAALIASDAPTGTPVHAAPSITILRHPGQTGSSPSASAGNMALAASSSGVIQPPNPQQATAPDPVIVQQPGQVIVQQAAPIAPPQAAPAAAPAPQTRTSR